MPGRTRISFVFVLGDVVGQHGDADAGAAGLHHAVDGVDLHGGAARRGIGAAEALEIVDVAEIGRDRLAEGDDAVAVEVLDGLRLAEFLRGSRPRRRSGCAP